MSTSQWSVTDSFTTKASYVASSETATFTYDTGGGGSFAASLDISSDGLYAIIADTIMSAAYIFIRSGNTWTLSATLYASDGTTNDNFGKAVAINLDGTRVIVGDPSKTNAAGTGKAYAFS